MDEFCRGGLRNFQLAVEALDAQATQQLSPRGLQEVSVVDALYRTLRAGHPDELGWEELEQVCELELGGAPVAFVRDSHMVLTDGRSAVVFDKQKAVSRHTLALPPEARLAGLRYANEQLQVAWLTDDDQLVGYWSGLPDRVVPFTVEEFVSARSESPSGLKLERGAPYLAADPLGPVQLPGSEVLLSGAPGGLCFYDLEGWPLLSFEMGARYPEGGLPHPFWSSLSVRDPQGSAFLRQLTREQVQALYEAEDPVPAAVTHPSLKEGVRATVRLARRWQERLTQLLQRSRGEVRLVEELVERALFPFAPGAGVSAPGTVLELDGPLGFLRGGEAPRGLESSVVWWAALPFLKALAWRAAAPFTPGTEREVLLAFLESWAELDLAPLNWRSFAARFEPSELPWEATSEVSFAEYRGNRYLLRYDEFGYALEVAHSGDFIDPPGVEIAAAVGPDPWATPARLRRVVELVRQRGPVPTHPEVVEALVEASELPDPLGRLVWAGAPHLYEALPPQLLRMLQLGSEPAGAAQDYLGQPYVLGQLLAAFWDDDPARAWEDPLAAAPRLARTWDALNQ